MPGKITSIEGHTGIVNVAGAEVVARLDLVDDPTVGDYVLVHAGLAISKVDPAEAAETMGLLREAGFLVQ